MIIGQEELIINNLDGLSNSNMSEVIHENLNQRIDSDNLS